MWPAEARFVQKQLVNRARQVSAAVTTRMFAILIRRFASTRLETRTKESNVYASIWVQNPDA